MTSPAPTLEPKMRPKTPIDVALIAHLMPSSHPSKHAEWAKRFAEVEAHTLFDLRNYGNSEWQALALPITLVANMKASVDRHANAAYEFVTHARDQHEAACSWLNSVKHDYRETESSPCRPFRVSPSWGGETLKQELLMKSSQLHRGGGGKDQPCLLGLRLGYGCGKSHTLLEAPTHLSCPLSVYITYGGNQWLTEDIRRPRQAALMRILLRLFGIANSDCPNFFQRYPAVLDADLDDLRSVVSFELARRLGEIGVGETVQFPSEIATTKLFIGVDEMDTRGNHVNVIKDELEELVTHLFVKRRIEVTVLISTLGTTLTHNDRSVLWVELPQPDQACFDFIVDQCLPDASPAQLRTANAVGGRHFRSIVTVCDTLSENVQCVDARRFIENINLLIVLTGEEHDAVLEYVPASCTSGSTEARKKYPIIAEIIGSDGGVPPAIVNKAFHKMTPLFAAYEHPAQLLFQASASNDARRLQRCGYEYDRFRAHYKLPVVPFGVSVVSTEPNDWEDLWFSTDSAYEDNNIDTDPFVCEQMTVKRTTEVPEWGNYYFPHEPNHPPIDRAVVAQFSKTEKDCLVLYLDQVESASFGDAALGLNAAAAAFLAEAKEWDAGRCFKL